MLLRLACGLRRSLEGSGQARCDSAAPDPSAGSTDLRRFETLPPEDSAKLLEVEKPSVEAADGAEPTANETPAEALPGLQQATEALQRKVDHLTALLAERATVDAEAWRVQKAVQHQEEADAEKLMELLRAHEEMFATSLEETKSEVEERVILRMREEQDLIQAQYDAQVDALGTAYAGQLQVATAAAEEAAQQRLEATLDSERSSLQRAHQNEILQERQDHSARLTKLQLQVDALDAAWSHDSQYKRTSHAVHQLGAAVLGIEESLAGRSEVPLRAQCDALPRLAERLDNPLLAEVATALKPLAATKVSTLPQLQERFATAAAAGHVAALVPEGSGMWGHALAKVVASITIAAPRDVLPSEAARSEASLILGTAASYLHEGSLTNAVREVRRLRGPPAAVCSGWLEAAEQRLLFEQALSAAKAEASITMAALC